jgi:purine-binding chemotaxis protein CheW
MSINKEFKKKETLQLVVFELDKEEYAVDIKDLQEIATIPEITPIPNAPKFIRGIINLRGKIIVILDLEKRFNLVREFELKDAGNIIITEMDQNNFGVVVDKVSEIISVPVDSVQETPTLVSSKINSEYLKGVILLEDEKKISKELEESSRLIILLDFHKMLKEKELLSIGEEVRKNSK